MRKIAFLFTLLVTVFVHSLPALAASPPVARTFLSAAGSDSNNCANVLTPCRHLATAYAATAANGEIYVLDPANYGSLTITGPVSIEGHGWASIAPPGVNTGAITVNANPGDKVNIIGVVLDGTGLAGATGIYHLGGSLSVRDSVIRNFPSVGIFMNVGSQISVSNSVISDNGNDGILLNIIAGTASCVLDHVVIENNAGTGVFVGTNSSALANVTISDSVISNSPQGTGIFATGPTSQAYVAVRRSNISNNGTGVLADSDAIIRLSQSVITGNATGWTTTNGGSVGSSGDNLIDDNPAGNGVPPGPLYK
jgi:Right handed beta helix region